MGLSYENMKEPENFADMKKAYHAFLARSSMLDLIDIYQKCCGLGLVSEDESIAPVSIFVYLISFFGWCVCLFLTYFDSSYGFMTLLNIHRISELFTSYFALLL